MNLLEHLYKQSIDSILGYDIKEHLPTLIKYANECNHITEFGVRDGCSTVALLSAYPQKMISYDIERTNRVNLIIEAARLNNINFNFILKNVLEIEIEETDLLFIDTIHTYRQLKQELRLHASKVKKYIIMHDTEVFKEEGEISKEKDKSDVRGLKYAIGEFLKNNKEWKIYEVFTNNNGLTIIKRNK